MELPTLPEVLEASVEISLHFYAKLTVHLLESE